MPARDKLKEYFDTISSSSDDDPIEGTFPIGTNLRTPTITIREII